MPKPAFTRTRRPDWLALAWPMVCLTVSACTGPVFMGASAAAVYVTKPDQPPPTDLNGQMAEHQSWCYRSLGYAQCYAHPQDVSPERLINVDPPSQYPLDPEAYQRALHPPPVELATPITAVVVPATSLATVPVVTEKVLVPEKRIGNANDGPAASPTLDMPSPY